MIENLKNKTILKVEGLELNNDMVRFWTSDGYRYDMYHNQDCCEHVSIEDINGDIDDILNSTILMAEEVSNAEDPVDFTENYSDSHTWTFYKIGTIKGVMVIRWLGSSNGYYSESVEVTENIDRQEVRDIKIDNTLC